MITYNSPPMGLVWRGGHDSPQIGETSGDKMGKEVGDGTEKKGGEGYVGHKEIMGQLKKAL